MREQGKISHLQAMNYVISTVFATAILFVPSISTQEASQDTWISVMVAAAFGILVAYLSASLGLKFPDKTVVQFSEVILGKAIGKIVGLIYVFYFFYVGFYVQRQFGELMTSAYMVKTPIIVFVSVLTLLACYLIYCGLEVLVRINDIVLTAVTVSFLLLFILIVKEIKIANFFPVMESGLGGIIRGSLAPGSWLGESAIIMMLIPFIANSKMAKKANITAVILLFISLELVAVGTVGVMGVHRTMRSIFPTFSLVREITFPAVPIIERQDIVLFMIIWVAGMLMKLSTFFYAGVLGLSQWLNLADYRPLVLPFGVILSALSILSWDNVIDIVKWSGHTFTPSITAVNFGLTLFLYLAALRKAKKNY